MKKLLISLLALSVVQLSQAQEFVKPEVALRMLRDGNSRFIAGQSVRPHQDINRIKEVASSQKPFATIVGCSDSRVPSEIIFDQGLGDLFIVRTAGQVSTYASWGSIEFAEEMLDTKLIVVMGHSGCGAVTAAVQLREVPGHIITLVNAIKPAVENARAKDPDNLLDASVRENILMQVKQLRELEPVLAKRYREGSIKIIGALYHMDTGRVEFFE